MKDEEQDERERQEGEGDGHAITERADSADGGNQAGTDDVAIASSDARADPAAATASAEAPEVDRPGCDSVADGEFRHVDPASITVDRIGNIIFVGLVTLAAAVVLPLAWLMEWFMPIGRWIATGGGIGFVVFLWFMAAWLPQRVWRHTTYRVSRLGIEIRRGIWWKHVIDVPRSRIQHTDIAQGPLQRRFRVSRLVIHTAGTEHASVDLTGLAYDRALVIRDFLIHGGERDGV